MYRGQNFWNGGEQTSECLRTNFGTFKACPFRESGKLRNGPYKFWNTKTDGLLRIHPKSWAAMKPTLRTNILFSAFNYADFSKSVSFSGIFCTLGKMLPRRPSKLSANDSSEEPKLSHFFRSPSMELHPKCLSSPFG